MSFGRLDRSPNAQPMSDINMTPLIDVMLVLVVIFIITAPLLASSIKLDLPHSDTARASDTPKFITVVVDAQGHTFLSDKAVSVEELAQRFAASRQEAPETEVQLRADKAVPYGRIVEVMDAAQKAGLNRIGFVSDAPAPTGSSANASPRVSKP